MTEAPSSGDRHAASHIISPVDLIRQVSRALLDLPEQEVKPWQWKHRPLLTRFGLDAWSWSTSTAPSASSQRSSGRWLRSESALPNIDGHNGSAQLYAAQYDGTLGLGPMVGLQIWADGDVRVGIDVWPEDGRWKSAVYTPTEAE
jgi:hypothetical protein